MTTSFRCGACVVATVSLFGFRLLADDPAASEFQAEAGFVALFNGENLEGWEGDSQLWSVQDGMLVGNSPGISRNEFLATTKDYENFELRLEFRMHGGKGNSGIQFRSSRIPDSPAVQGYQADLGQGFWGCLYDEHRRNKVLVQAPKELADVLKKDGWNTYVIRADGNHITLQINDLTTVDYTEQDAAIARSGIIALQIHSGGPMRIDFRNLRIKELATN
jgi:hypothetical protein